MEETAERTLLHDVREKLNVMREELIAKIERGDITEAEAKERFQEAVKPENLVKVTYL